MADAYTAEQKDSPAYVTRAAKDLHAQVKVVRDVFEGTRRVREGSTEYLPKHPAEESNDYQIRLNRTTLFNATRRTAKGLNGMIFRKDPVLSDQLPPALADQLGNVDNAGRDLAAFARDVGEAAILDGVTHIMVDFPPATEDVRSLADERREGLRPYWVPVTAASVINWRYVTRGGKPVLTLAAIHETSSDPEGEFGEEEVERVRVLRLRPEGATWQLYRKTKERWGPETAEVPFRRAGGTVLERIPLVQAYTDRLGFMRSSPPLLDLAYENILHYQVRSDHLHALHMGSIPIPVFVGRNDRDRAIKWGPGYAIDIPEGGSAFYLEPGGSALAHTRQELKDIEARMAALGLQMLVRETRAAETAEAKSLDKAESDSALAASAGSLERGIVRAIELHAEWLGAELPADEKPVTLNRDFTNQELDPATIGQLRELWKEHGISLDTLWDMLEAGEVLKLGDREVERERIQDEEAAGLERMASMFSESGPSENGDTPEGRMREPEGAAA